MTPSSSLVFLFQQDGSSGPNGARLQHMKCSFQARLLPFHMEVDGDLTRLAMGRMTSVVRSPFSPAQPCARRGVRFSQGRWRDALFEGPFQSFFQACLYVPLQGWARWLPTARTSHPPDPAHAETCADPSEHRPINGPSKLACSFPKSSLDQSKRARVKEHRP